MDDDSVLVTNEVSDGQERPNKRKHMKGSEDSNNSLSEIDREDEGETVAEMIREILAEMRVMRTEMVEIKEELRKEVGEMLRTELHTMSERVDELKSDIKEDMKKQNEQIETVKERLEKNENDITKLNSKIAKELSTKSTDLTSRLEALENKLSHVSITMKDLAWKSIDNESRMRRNNLLFHGIQEEKMENCTKKIEHFLKNVLNITEPVAIQRAHRLGKPLPLNSVGKKAGRPRPIIVNFLDYRQREAIRAERSKLKHPHGISEDLPFQVRKARESLIPELKELKQRGKNCSIVWPARLLVEGNVVKEVDVTKIASKA